MTKPGYKTTEFYVLLVVLLMGVLAQSGLFGADHWISKAVALVTSTLAAIGYTAARAKTKFGTSIEQAASAEAKK